MIVSYCKKCKIESEGAVCQQCGKRAPASGMKDVWRTVRVPSADAGAWRSAVGALSFVVIVLLAVLLLAERFGAASQQNCPTPEQWLPPTSATPPTCTIATNAP